jgi:hypothetical protein
MDEIEYYYTKNYYIPQIEEKEFITTEEKTDEEEK